METISDDIRQRIETFIKESGVIRGVVHHRVLGVRWDSNEDCYIVSTWNSYHGYKDEWCLWEPTDSHEEELSIAGFYGEN